MSDEQLARLLEEILRVGRAQDILAAEYAKHTSEEMLVHSQNNDRLSSLEARITHQLTREEREFIKRRMAADKSMEDFWTAMRMKILEKGIFTLLLVAVVGVVAVVQYKLTGTVPDISRGG